MHAHYSQLTWAATSCSTTPEQGICACKQPSAPPPLRRPASSAPPSLYTLPNARSQLQVLWGTWKSGTPDARLPARASSTCKVVGKTPQPLRSESHAHIGPWPLAGITLGREDRACRGPGPHSSKLRKDQSEGRLVPPGQYATQEVAPQGSAFGALARTDHWTRGAPFDRSRGASLGQTASYRWHVCVPAAGASQQAAAKHRPLGASPPQPLPTGSGAHGLCTASECP